ncbi:MAG: DUF4340 domain-containing protein [Syntrophaceae bacterium]
MRPRTLIISLVILAAALSYYLYFEVYKPRQSQERQAQEALVFSLDKQALEKLVVTGKERIELTKQDKSWMITAPISARVDERTLEELVNSLATLKRQRELIDFSDLSVFASPLRIEFRAASQDYTLTIGRQTPTKEFRYAQVSSSPGVFLIKDADSFGLDKDLLSLRDKRLFTFPIETIEALSFSGPFLNLKLVKNADAAWHCPGKDIKLNAGKVETLLQQIWWQEATLFADGMSIGTAPLLDIKLTGKQGSQELKVWRMGKALFARSSRHPQVVEIDRMFLESLPRDVGMLTEKGGAL